MNKTTGIFKPEIKKELARAEENIRETAKNLTYSQSANKKWELEQINKLYNKYRT